ncbi:unnamed protein product [Onchocerca ochengi]|uniref:Fer2_3 domain-containing protein n=1 Tax=Onchocerca ochengi TaxID=42157 RepID=A0A182E7L3_ONCOC|nr:unnamed protein product [Onchocerca ochengi]
MMILEIYGGAEGRGIQQNSLTSNDDNNNDDDDNDDGTLPDLFDRTATPIISQHNLLSLPTGCREQACNACTCRTALNCRTAMDLDGTTHFTLIAYRSSLKEFVTSMVIE